jgi:hypothetical protein
MFFSALICLCSFTDWLQYMITFSTTAPPFIPSCKLTMSVKSTGRRDVDSANHTCAGIIRNTSGVKTRCYSLLFQSVSPSSTTIPFLEIDGTVVIGTSPANGSCVFGAEQLR